MRAPLLAVALGLVLVMPASASAAQRFAAPTGTGADPCASAADPCPILIAIESAGNNDEVILAGGTYNVGATSIDTPVGNALDIHPAPGAAVRIEVSSTSSGFALDSAGSTLSDVTIEYSTGTNSGLLVRANSTIRRVFVHSADSSRACGFSGASVTMTDSVCWSSRAAGGGAGFTASNGTFTLRNVTAIGSGGTTYGIDATAAPTQTTTVNATNVIAQGPGEDIRAFETDGTATTTVNLTNSNSVGPPETSSGGTVNDLGGNQTATAPTFVDASTGNFREASTSVTRNAGTAAGLLGTELDLDRAARNQGTAPDIGAYEFDDTAPTASITSGPAEGETITTAATAFGFASTEAGTFQCQLDGGGFGTCSGPGATHSLSGLANGAHAFSVRAIDATGNVSAPVTRNFSVAVPSGGGGGGGGDGGGGGAGGGGAGGGGAGGGTPPDTDPPETLIDKTKVKGDDVKVTFRSDEAGSTFECKLDKKPFRPCTSPRKVKNLDDGKHKVLVVATDAAGNTDPTTAKSKFEIG